MARRDVRSGRGFLVGTTEDSPPLAASLLVGALFFLGLQDVFIKLTSSELSLWQFQFCRAALNLLLLTVFVRVFWRGELPTPKRPWAVALRSLFLCGALVLYYSGMPFLSLAELATGLYVFPLFVAVLSRLVLGEKVGPRRVIAILTGFLGTLLILKPGTDAFTPVALMPVAAGFFYACTVLSTRKLCREESPITLTYGVSIAFLIMGIIGLLVFTNQPVTENSSAWPYLFTGWKWVDIWVYGVIAICSMINVTANISWSKAYQSAEASWLAPFDYSYLVFATFWGFLIWHDIPDGLMFIGMLLIAGSGAYVVWRQRQEKSSPPSL